MLGKRSGKSSFGQACDACRKKKIRCEPTVGGCAQCTKYSTACHFTPIATKRKPRRPPGFRYIAQLEQRLAEVEGVLKDKSLGVPTVPDSSLRAEQKTPAVFNNANTTALITFPDEINPWTSIPGSQVTFTQQADSQGYDFDLSFGAPSHGKPDFSALTGYVNDHLVGSASPHLAPESYAPSPLATRQSLPTKTAALELVNETFVNYNRFLPLFDEEDFLREFQLKYSTSTPRDPGWWACLNVVLSIAHRLRGLRTLDPTRENVLAFGHIQNALGVVSELSVSEHSLSAVQALIGMACILQGTPNPAPAAMLVAAALRLAQAMDLHRECPGSPLTMQQLEKRRRVFWKAYILDKDISLRTGRPFSQDDDDMDVRLPSRTGSQACDVDMFNHRIRLAVIQGLVYKQLYSIRAERQTEMQRALAAHELSVLLSHWKASADLDLPVGSSVSSGPPMSGEVINKVVMRLTYIHCLAMIDHHLDHQSPSSSYQDLSQGGLQLPQGSLCLIESRKAIQLIEFIPHGDCSCIWMLLHAFFAAARSILANLAQNPTLPDAPSDLRLVEPFMRLLGMLAGDSYSQSEELGRMHRTCNDLHNDAKKAVETFGPGSLMTSTWII